MCVNSRAGLHTEPGRMPLADGGALRWLVPVKVAIRFYDLSTWDWMSMRKKSSVSRTVYFLFFFHGS